MAIFGKADADLPRLTWIAQVDTSKPEEVLHLLRRWPGAAEDIGAFLVPDVTLREHEILAKMDATDNPAEKVNLTEEWVRWTVQHAPALKKEAKARYFIDTIQLVQRIMDSLYHTQGFNGDDFQKWNDLCSRFTFGYEVKPGFDPDARFLPVEQIQPVYVASGEVFTPLFHVMTSMDAVIKQAFEGNILISKCEECHGLFETTRAKQMYCSHRCADRVSARRRYAEKKENVSD